MLIEIKRHNTNVLYTEGRLYINDMRTTYTVEASECMLPAGIYRLKIVKKSARKQYIGVFETQVSNGFNVPKSFNPETSETSEATETSETLQPTGWTLGIGQSWISSKKNHIIAIGQPFFPGAVYKATPVYERIVDRLMKCEARGESIRLVITDDNCTHGLPIRHWTEPSDHGCPPSNRRVERIDDRHYDIYDGDTFVKTVVLPEKKDTKC